MNELVKVTLVEKIIDSKNVDGFKSSENENKMFYVLTQLLKKNLPYHKSYIFTLSNKNCIQWVQKVATLW